MVIRLVCQQSWQVALPSSDDTKFVSQRQRHLNAFSFIEKWVWLLQTLKRLLQSRLNSFTVNTSITECPNQKKITTWQALTTSRTKYHTYCKRSSIEKPGHKVCTTLLPLLLSNCNAIELQQDIDKDSAKYIRHSIRAANATPSTPSSRAASPKSSLIPAKIAAHYAEIQELSSEKCLLAQRLIDLITLSRARLDSDLVKVRILQGEIIEPPSVSKITIGESLTASVRTPALAHATESLRVALASAALPDARAGYGSPTPMTASAAVGGSVTKSELFYIRIIPL